MQKTSTTRHCSNCYYPLPRFGSYCSHCGQKYKERRVTVWELVKEFFSGILNFENRIWATLGAMFRPGKLTKAFFLGRQQRYVNPLRFFFVTGLLFFAIFNYWVDMASGSSIEELVHQQAEDNYRVYFMDQLRYVADTVKQDFTDVPQATQAVDSLYQRMRGETVDSLSLGFSIQLFNGNLFAFDEDTTKNFKVARKDIAHLTVDSLMAIYGQDKNYTERLLMRQNIRFQNSGESFLSFFVSKLVWMMLILMPLLALLLKLLYIRRGYFYVEHLIFSFHLHAFIFILSSIVLVATQSGLLPQLFPASADSVAGKLWAIYGIWLALYFFQALRRVYGQSRRKTFVKFVLLNMSYVFILLFAVIFTAAITALLY